MVVLLCLFSLIMEVSDLIGLIKSFVSCFVEWVFVGLLVLLCVNLFLFDLVLVVILMCLGGGLLSAVMVVFRIVFFVGMCCS